MKRFFATILALCMILCAGCAATPTETTASAVNEGELQMGVYGGSAAYAAGEFSMIWTFTIHFAEDGSFRLINEAAEEKGAGTWSLTDNCYTMTYSDDRTATFVIHEDGALEFTSDLPFGKNGISSDMVGGIVLSYMGESSDIPESNADAATGATAGTRDDTMSAGTCTASYTC